MTKPIFPKHHNLPKLSEEAMAAVARPINAQYGNLLFYGMSLKEATNTSEIIIPDSVAQVIANDVIAAYIIHATHPDLPHPGTTYLLDPNVPAHPLSGQTKPYEPGYYLVKFHRQEWVDHAIIAEVLPPDAENPGGVDAD